MLDTKATDLDKWYKETCKLQYNVRLATYRAYLLRCPFLLRAR